jgi:hypothetical protein
MMFTTFPFCATQDSATSPQSLYHQPWPAALNGRAGLVVQKPGWYTHHVTPDPELNFGNYTIGEADCPYLFGVPGMRY